MSSGLPAGDSPPLCTVVSRPARRCPQGHTAKDFLRRLKAKYVHSSQAQADGAADPSAFAWASMGGNVADLFRGAPGMFCMVCPTASDWRNHHH